MKIKIIDESKDWFYVLSYQKTKKVIDLLEESKLFEEKVSYLRKKHKIPQEWLDNEKKDFEVLSEFSFSDPLFEDSLKLNYELGLPYYWWSSIAHFIAFNIFFTPEVIPIEIYLKKSVSKICKQVNYEQLHIVIHENLSKEQLHKLIDQEWDRIKKRIKRLPNLEAHRMTRASLAKEITELRDSYRFSKKRMCFKDIADKLAKKYESNIDIHDLLTEDYVKNLYRRWKQKLKKLNLS